MLDNSLLLEIPKVETARNKKKIETICEVDDIRVYCKKIAQEFALENKQQRNEIHSKYAADNRNLCSKGVEIRNIRANFITSMELQNSM